MSRWVIELSRRPQVQFQISKQRTRCAIYLIRCSSYAFGMQPFWYFIPFDRVASVF